ncbi:MAG: aminomethyl-transferring glycine dehydrogenase subunit GcvPA [Spirochaetes bacterium]|nr:MAG: aminomethyl-transferring glycine dehydrogenase subunit GcvPA [Spirochaetota bacterium]
MTYTCTTNDDREHMLKEIGVGSVDDLFSDIPEAIRLGGVLDLPEPLGEQEASRLAEGLASNNRICVSFAGAGAYNHYVPAVVDALSSRSEFYTAYTPYQPEVSQGTLTAIFEFQSMIARLTGMDVANASLYDGATALVEAVLMAVRTTGRTGILVSSAVHPHYREVLRTYAWANDLQVREIPAPRGTTDPGSLKDLMDDSVAAVAIQNPNFFGCIEDLASHAAPAHGTKACLIALVTEPVSMGILKSPGACGADIACGEAASLGNYMGFGGPALGFIAAGKSFMRNMPGRLVGKSVDTDGREAYVLTLQTREQHIRRERATSNICTNQGLCALRTVMYLALVGPRLRALADLNHRLASLCKNELGKKGISPVFDAPYFNEFAVRVRDPEKTIARLAEQGMNAGVSLGRYYPEYADSLLVCCTESTTSEDIRALASML